MKFITTKEEEEKKIRLCLVQEGSYVKLKGIDDHRRSWDIMEFNKGTFRRCISIPDDIGIEVDDNTSIIEDSENIIKI